jgi:hypothetical protein
MKNLLNKIQQKIYAIFHALKAFASKLRISSFVGGQFKKRHDTRLLKNMDDYKINFDLDSKIAWNRHRMREVFEMYKKIENYYPLFFIFLGFIGIYYFDFIILLFNNFNHWFLLTTSLTTIGLISISYYLIKIIFTVKWESDNTPNKIYDKLHNETKLFLLNNKYKNKKDELTKEIISKKTKKIYLESLEENYDINYNHYVVKKRFVKHILKLITITFFVFSLNVLHYKYLDMAKDKKPKPDKERVDEGNKSNTIKPLITEQDKKPKNVVSFSEFISEKENSDSLRIFIRQIIQEELKNSDK